MSEKQILITVGTTKFENLIKAIDSEKFYEMLINNGFTKIIFQKGYGEYIPKNYKNYENKIKIQISEILNNFENIIKSSELIISHGGAGIILESLKNKRKVIVCVNDKLMDNHQIELATSLHENGYVYYCKNLSNIIEDTEKVISNHFKLKEYPEFNYDIIPNAIYVLKRILHNTTKIFFLAKFTKLIIIFTFG